jgi:GIY-YIG catalytic domain
MDRKAAIRAYKETPRPMGVYQVRNTANGKLLVGSSANLPAMLNRHRAQLEMGGHRNRALQQDWNELGPGVFEFEILDTLKPPNEPDYDPSEDLRVLEEMWLEKLAPFGERGYNATPKRTG